MNLVIQLLVFAFVFFAISRTVLRFKDRKINVKEFFFWITIWVSIIILVSIPDTVGFLTSNLIGIARPVDLGLYISTIILFYLIFRIYVKLEMMEQNLTKIVRELSRKK